MIKRAIVKACWWMIWRLDSRREAMESMPESVAGPASSDVSPEPNVEEPDLTFVTTQDLFSVISSRYECCTLIVCRVSGDARSAELTALTHQIGDLKAFLKSYAEHIDQGGWVQPGDANL